MSAVSAFPRVVVVTHDNPDPDAIAAGWALKFLLDQKTDKKVRLIAGGEIVRAENRQMVKLLNPPLELVDRFNADRRTAVILVDCGLVATNHLVNCDATVPVAVVDHHDPPPDAAASNGDDSVRRTTNGRKKPVMDVRPNVAAAATMGAAYLREQNLEPDQMLATGLLYAIRSETRGFETHFSPLDRAVLPWVTKRADPSLLARIENAPLSEDYFSDLVLALQNTFLYGDAAFCMLPQAAGPEIIGEVADLLVRREGVGRVLCAAVFGKSVLVSVRTDQNSGNATELLYKSIQGIGRGGGHTHRAGGKLFERTEAESIPGNLRRTLRTRWLRACGLPRQRGARLLSKREIVKNL